jgi:hypothetical protein
MKQNKSNGIPNHRGSNNTYKLTEVTGSPYSQQDATKEETMEQKLPGVGPRGLTTQGLSSPYIEPIAGSDRPHSEKSCQKGKVKRQYKGPSEKPK